MSGPARCADCGRYLFPVGQSHLTRHGRGGVVLQIESLRCEDHLNCDGGHERCVSPARYSGLTWTQDGARAVFT